MNKLDYALESVFSRASTQRQNSLWAQFTGPITEDQARKIQTYDEAVNKLKYRKNFASSSSGASVLRATPDIVSKSAILSSDDEKYLILRDCDASNPEEMVINLSDDVQIDSILVTNQEDFSDTLAQI